MSQPQSSATPASAELRAELEHSIVLDLYGPAGGPDEQLSEMPPRDRYLVGVLAPTGVVAVDPERQDGSTSHDDAVDATPEDQNSVPVLFPSSKGLSFAVEVPAQAESVVVGVTASWGRYVKTEVATPVTEETAEVAREAPAATPVLRVWQRQPAGGTVDLVLLAQGGPIAPLQPDPAQPGVVVRGLATRRGGALLVSLFLVNEQEEPKRNKDSAWLFQAELAVSGPAGDDPLFVGRETVLGEQRLSGSPAERAEMEGLELLYRKRVEFAVGHGSAVHAVTEPGNPYCATRVETRSMPRYEVARTEAPSPTEPGFEHLAATTLDMRVLAESSDGELVKGLLPLVGAYRNWIEAQAERLTVEDDLAGHVDAADSALAKAREAADRLNAGVALLSTDTEACEAFRFANWAMWQQRIHTIAAANRTQDQAIQEAVTEADVPRNRSWRPFQLAFLLLNLRALTDPMHPERTDPGLVDLLFFPTGGGKTEAYLGLTAYTFAIRRLQGDRFGPSGHDGVAVLMRYTLRLLTAQQFQRATALVSACEIRRRHLVSAGDTRWGEVPFRIGLWVGASVTPNRQAAAAKAVQQAQSSGWGASGATPLQLSSCPWCGSKLTLGSDVKVDPITWRTVVYCSDPYGFCPLTEAGEARDGVVGEGIPVVTVDEEIYRVVPSLVISTVDKFAQLPWQGPLHLLFGRTSRRCTRHGYRSVDLDQVGERKEADTHPARGGLPRAQTVDVGPLRPPDLIIQDELHLISGPLGTMVGLYETAIDRLATWNTDGVAVRPKVIASTATVRRAHDQVHAVFARRLSVFPPPVLDVEDNFFSVQRNTAEASGRLYLGVAGFGQRLKNVETRVFITVLAAAQRLFERYGDAADPWMTMVGYFNALRELAGARRIIEDDVRARLPQAARRGLGERRLRIVEELTSRMSSADIPATLDQLGEQFTAAGEARRAAGRGASARGKAKSKAKTEPGEPYRPIDVLLATNMISVGVDVSRLGLMVAVGQPKATAEYIQATSRVGRSDAGPGLVLTIYNWARPRDLSHYETFEHYHATYYKHVEAMSVTPFAPRARDRGLTGVFVGLVRHLHPGGVGVAWNPDPGAQIVPETAHEIDQIAEAIATRAANVDGRASVADDVRDALDYRRTRWAKRQTAAKSGGSPLAYRGMGGAAEPLLRQPVPGVWDEWKVPNSLRETEPSVNLLIDLWETSLGDAPAFHPLPQASSDSAEEPTALTAEDRTEDELAEEEEQG